MRKSILIAIGVAAAWMSPAQAQTADAGTETVIVTGDAAHLIETTPSATAFGLPMTLIDTPRAVTVISDTTISRYGIDGVNDLTAITPSAYTSSFYGVAGAVNLRGTLAETYFRGFKRAENRGTYDTPIGDASQIEILRGPPSPIYGAGKVGGLLNFIPKTAEDEKGYLTDITGSGTLTYGSYSRRNLTGQIGMPLDLGFAHGGFYAYGEIDDSFSFYRGIHPSHQLLETSAGFDLGGGASISADYMYYHSNGDVQTPGWNRLTQDLIDNGNYQAGRDTDLKDADGNGRLTVNEFGGNLYAGQGMPLYLFGGTDAWHTLDTGIAIKKLDPRTVYIAPGVDFSNTITHTGYLQFAQAMGDLGTAKLELFTDRLSNDRFVSYGFPASYRTEIYEMRLSDSFAWNGFDGALKTNSVVGASYRYTHGIGKESFNSGVIALDRRDITAGAMPNDIIDSPFNVDPPGAIGLGWENDVRTTTANAGLFVTSEFGWNGLNLILGGRYDDYNVRSVDKGILPFEAPSGAGDKGIFTGSASLSYRAPLGLVPYVTIAKNAAVEIGQADQVLTSLFAGKAFISASNLTEGGIKFAFLDDHLVGSLVVYAQDRTQLTQGIGTATVQGTSAQGEELEIRLVADENWSFTFAGNLQHTRVKGPTGFLYIPARLVGVSPVNGFGGTYVTFDYTGSFGGMDNYDDTLIPHAVLSPYVTYTSDRFDWGVVGGTFGGSYVARTMQTVATPIVFPSYLTLNLSLFARHGSWEADFNIDNLTDKLYFTPDADTYATLAALPGIGRVWRLTLKKSF